jgi:hypothetical protein
MKKKKTLRGQIDMERQIRFINSEYKRGFMEGQQAVMGELAALMDHIMSRYNHISRYTPVSGLLKEKKEARP